MPETDWLLEDCSMGLQDIELGENLNVDGESLVRNFRWFQKPSNKENKEVQDELLPMESGRRTGNKTKSKGRD